LFEAEKKSAIDNLLDESLQVFLCPRRRRRRKRKKK
jgi:hypothetical protein